jgi:type IV secretory pathway TraG/TraD family ATPase VirD4
VTLYLVLPVNRLRTHGRWLRMILTQVIAAIAARPEPPELPVTMLLDELGTISPGSGLSMIEQSYGLMAGLGIRIWAFLQDLPQLQRDYPNSWETFISNSSVIQLLNIADSTTAKYFSDYLGTMTVNAKTGGKSLRTQPYMGGDSFEERARNLAATILANRGEDPKRSREVIDQARAGTYNAGGFNVSKHLEHDKHQRVSEAWDKAKQTLHDQGYTEQGYSAWVDDEQLASRPVMFPWELVDVDSSTTVLIFPGKFNLQLKRFRYFSDPVMSRWARQDPNKPAAEITARVKPASVPLPPPVQPPPRQPLQQVPQAQPPNATPAASLGSVANEVGSAVGGWLNKKIQDKISGR